MKTKSRLIGSILSLILSSVLLLATIYAFFTLRPTAEVQEFISMVGTHELEVRLGLKKNEDEDFTYVTTQEEIASIFQDTVPSDSFVFQLEIKNISDFEITANISLFNVTGEAGVVNMLDVFYLVDGVVLVDGATYKTFSGDPEDTEILGQTVNSYRLSYLIDANNNLQLASGLALAIDAEATITFTLCYDQETSHSSYQEGVIHIEALKIYYQ
jgi:hypothetical protein